ncbi:hypothetical protein BDZ85DRAFT_283498 [Elsinoe ampelina]|uniref:Rhodopsin domain-containing protein n=1 Tax=Elsinoe ampelina TaxID=302913 RepID=A0A6A6G6X8_9PEZI|nr:hypothetical protein BDZ85DRAFT_283498 [Elsinoe ampelina]
MSTTATAAKRSALGGRGPGIMAGGWVLCGLGIILVLLRLWAASKKAGKLRWDFLWITLGILWCIASHACFTVALNYGIGNHVRNLRYSEVFDALHWMWISLFVGIVGGVFSKFAIISLLLEVQSPNAKGRRIMLWTLGGILGATGLTQILLSWLKCEPVAKLWNPTLPGVCPRAVQAANFSYYQGAINAFADIFLSLFPITIVWNLQASKKVKIGFCALMAFGAIPSIAVIIRTTLLKRLATSKDITWDFGPFMIWASTELWSVIIIGSIPPLRPLFLRLFSKVSSQVTTSRGTGARTQNTQDRTGIGMSKLNRSALDKKGGISTHSRQIIDIESDGSTENVLANDHLAKGIMVKHDVEIETGRPSDVSSGVGRAR